MTKKYKLLKPLPGSKPGDIYVWNNSQKVYYKDGNVLDIHFVKESVEDYADWFQEIKEDKPQWEILSFKHNNFIYHWDEVSKYNRYSWEFPASLNHVPEKSQILSVKRLSDGEVFTLGDRLANMGNKNNKIDGFFTNYNGNQVWLSINIDAGYGCSLTVAEKAKEPERIEVVHIRENEFTHFGGNCGYAFETVGKIPKEKFPAIKKAIEDCLNETPQKTYTQQEMDEAIQDAFNSGRYGYNITLIDYLRILKNKS